MFVEVESSQGTSFGYFVTFATSFQAGCSCCRSELGDDKLPGTVGGVGWTSWLGYHSDGAVFRCLSVARWRYKNGDSCCFSLRP